MFIEGNRTKIDNSNVVESYNKIKAWGFIETMPIEYFPMEEAKDKLGGRKLYKPTIARKKGEGSATISNFEIKMVEVQEADYDKYDGVCGDGQHRTIALMFDELKDVTATYQPVKLSKENMDILAYISIRNNGRKWSNDDFYASNISTGDTNADYILNKRKEGYIPAFLISDDRFTGRFGAGLKAFFTECKDIEMVVNTINLINKENWNKYFTPVAGQSMEAKSYKEALLKLAEQVKE